MRPQVGGFAANPVASAIVATGGGLVLAGRAQVADGVFKPALQCARRCAAVIHCGNRTRSRRAMLRAYCQAAWYAGQRRSCCYHRMQTVVNGSHVR